MNTQRKIKRAIVPTPGSDRFEKFTKSPMGECTSVEWFSNKILYKGDMIEFLAPGESRIEYWLALCIFDREDAMDCEPHNPFRFGADLCVLMPQLIHTERAIKAFDYYKSVCATLIDAELEILCRVYEQGYMARIWSNYYHDALTAMFDARKIAATIPDNLEDFMDRQINAIGHTGWNAVKGLWT